MKCFCGKRMYVKTRSERKGKRYGKLPGLVRKYYCHHCKTYKQTLEIELSKADLLGKTFTRFYPNVNTMFDQ